MTPAQADAHADNAAAYVHIPFCSAICPYCDFAVVAGKDDMATRYVEALLREVERSSPWRPLQAVYFGGGTPSHISPVLLSSILDRLAAHHGLAPEAEITLEANPEDFSVARARAFSDLGFNRVSFGAQSFDEDVLAVLGRRHGPGDIEASVAAARDAGFADVSIDLIYGSQGESRESWAASVERAIALDLAHVSAYALTVERGTPLGREVAAGADGPDPDEQADRYLVADSAFDAAGFTRYEVSNWARPGHECRYNLTVWAQGEYVAYGNGAHGYRNGVRYRNHRRLEAYMTAIEENRSPRAGEDAIAGWDAELDRLFVGLRRAAGVATGPGTDALLSSDEGRALVDAGIVRSDSTRLRVSKPLLTDAVHRTVLALTGPIVVGSGNA